MGEWCKMQEYPEKRSFLCKKYIPDTLLCDKCRQKITILLDESRGTSGMHLIAMPIKLILKAFNLVLEGSTDTHPKQQWCLNQAK